METACAGSENRPPSRKEDSREEAQHGVRTKSQSEESEASGLGQPRLPLVARPLSHLGILRQNHWPYGASSMASVNWGDDCRLLGRWRGVEMMCLKEPCRGPAQRRCFLCTCCARIRKGHGDMLSGAQTV